MDIFTGKENERALERVNVRDLEPSPLNTYRVDDYEDLKGSLLSCGLINPLAVIGPSEEGKYQILSGERRYHAMCDINAEGEADGTGVKFETVPVYVLGPADMDTLQQQLYIETSNLETRDDSEMNRNDHRFRVVSILKSMKENEGKTQSELVDELEKYLKVSKRYSRMYLQIFDSGIDELKSLLTGESDSDAHVKVTDGSKIANMDPEDQAKVTTLIKSGTKPQEAISTVKAERRKAEKQKETDEKIKRTQKTAEELDAELTDDFGEDYLTSLNEKYEDDETLYDDPDYGSAFQDVSYGKDPGFSLGFEHELPSSEEVAAWLRAKMQSVQLADDDKEVFNLCREWVDMFIFE